MYTWYNQYKSQSNLESYKIMTKSKSHANSMKSKTCKYSSLRRGSTNEYKIEQFWSSRFCFCMDLISHLFANLGWCGLLYIKSSFSSYSNNSSCNFIEKLYLSHEPLMNLLTTLEKWIVQFVVSSNKIYTRYWSRIS